MGIVIRVNGSGAGDGFLITPDNGCIFSVPLNLSTDDGSTVTATIDAIPNGTGVVLPGGNISVGPAVKVIPINATAVSNAQGDTIINVRVGGSTTSLSLTAISNPEIWFKGRFEGRFASRRDLWQS